MRTGTDGLLGLHQLQYRYDEFSGTPAKPGNASGCSHTQTRCTIHIVKVEN